MTTAHDLAEDDDWLRRQIIRLLQSYIEPSRIGDIDHVATMARARRLLRRMGVVPITETTVFERIAAHAVVRVPLVRVELTD